jgi:hypothetical protein
MIRSGLFLVALGLLTACAEKKPKEGDVCKIEDEGSLVCADATTALHCVTSKRVAVRCRGPNAASTPPSEGRASSVAEELIAA